MHFNERTRRQFLIGAGQLSLALPLPVLPSLLPRAAQAQALGKPPLRFLHCIHAWSEFTSTFHPKGLTLQPLGNPSDNVKGAPLSGVTGPISKVISSAFNGIRGKMNIVHGLHILSGQSGHNASYPTCASGGGEAYIKPAFPHAVESLLSKSEKVYPDGVAGGKEPFLNVCHRRPKAGPVGVQDTYAWTPSGRVPGMTDPAAVYSVFMGSFNKKVVDPRTDRETLARINVMDDVHRDYRSVIDGGKISSDDRLRLDAYTTLIAEVRTKLASPVLTCANEPTRSSDGSKDMTNIIAAAMACQLTNVIDFVITPEGPLVHDLQHDLNEELYSNYTAEYGKIYAGLWTELDRLKEPDGTSVLDNSLVAWVTSNGLDTVHGATNMPLVTAGGAGGQLRTGYFLDFGGRPYNNWLITILNAFGLQAADYEKVGGQVGVGDYKNTRRVTAYISDSEKRKPLPFIWKAA